MPITNDLPVTQNIPNQPPSLLDQEFDKLFIHVENLKLSLDDCEERGALHKLKVRIRKISDEKGTEEVRLSADLIELVVWQNDSFKQEASIRADQRVADILLREPWESAVPLWEQALRGEVLSRAEMHSFKDGAIRRLKAQVAALDLSGSKQGMMRRELETFITNLFHLVELKEEAKFTRRRNGFSVELDCFYEKFGEIPPDTRIPYDVGIVSNVGKVCFDVNVQNGSVKLNVHEHLRMCPVSEEKKESILESFSNMVIPDSLRAISRFLPAFIQKLLVGDGNGLRVWLRNKADESLGLVDGEIKYQEFTFFISKGYVSSDVHIRATRDDATDEQSLRARELGRQNLIANSYAERFARSAMNWGRMLLLPEGGNAKYINILFSPAEEGGRLTYFERSEKEE